MNTFHRFASAAILLGLASALPLSGADDKPTPIKAEQSWDGEIKIELRKDAPKDGFVADKDAWAKLWKTYRGDEKLPDVDFTKELVLVAVNSDPNRISLGASLDKNGDVRVLVTSTLVAYTNPTTCRYQFVRIKRDGIKTVGGKPIEKK